MTTRARRGEAPRVAEYFAMSQTDECLLWPFSSDRHGYGQLRVKGRLLAAHRYILTLATGVQPTRSMDTRHGPCARTLCCNPRHLQWGSRGDNIADMVRDGTDRGGERHPLARLSDDQVDEIRRRRAGGESGAKLAQEYGVGRSYIYNLARGHARKST